MAKWNADPLLCGICGAWHIYCEQGNIFLPIPQSNLLGILWPHIGTEKQDYWSKVTQTLVVEQDSQQVCGTPSSVCVPLPIQER